jgi:hypothetical protein
MMTNLIKTNRRFTTRVLMVLSVFLATIGAAFAQSEAFVYQGRLTDGGNPPTGSYDL